MTSDLDRGQDGPRDVRSRDRVLRHEWPHVVAALRLSARQAEIAQMLLNDATEAEIARRLQIAPGTVNSHIRRLYAKLGVNTRVALASCIWSQCIHSPPERVAPDQAPPD